MKSQSNKLYKQQLNYLSGGIVATSLILATAIPGWGDTPPLVNPSIQLDVPSQKVFQPHSVVKTIIVDTKPVETQLQLRNQSKDLAEEAIAQSTETAPTEETQTEQQQTPNTPANDLDLTPEIINNSPVLQRWQQKVPNILEEIRRDPSFRTRVRLGYSQFPSTNEAGGINVGVEDIFIGRSGLTVSGDYQTSFNGNRSAGGADLRYYVLPLGSYINFAPVVGYRYLETPQYSRDGLNVGARLMLALSRGGAADLSLTQSWVSPGSSEEVGITTLSVGYAITRNFRLSTDIQKQNAKERKDSRVGIVFEWMP